MAYRDAETHFVRLIRADRRKRVVNTLYSSTSLAARTVDLVKIWAALAVCIGAGGMLYHNISWGYRCRWTYLVWGGVLVWCSCGAIHGARTYRKCQGAESVHLAGSVIDTTALSYVPMFTTRLCALSLVGIAVVATITMFGKLDTKTDAIIETCLVTGLIVSGLVLQISFKSFSGIYAPIIAHWRAPTILPVFALFTGAAVTSATCVGLQFQPESLLILRLVNAFRLAAWVMWLLAALGAFNANCVANERAERVARRLDQQRENTTPLTGGNTPKVKGTSSP